MNCPNKNHPDWIKIVNALGEEAALKAFILNNEEIPDADEYLKDINFTLKVVDKLVNLSNVRTTIRLNSKEQPYIETNLRKTLNGQGVTNQQIDLIFDYMKSNNIKEISTKELALEMAANYSFNVEINTAKANEDKQVIQQGDDEEFTFKGSIYKYKNGEYLKDDQIIDLIEYESVKNEAFTQPNTQHYANLTVPGGTNYTENEIATPAITPSIKGHAEFSTNSGIGWFRSDEKALISKPDDELAFPDEFIDNQGYKWKNINGIWSYFDEYGVNKRDDLTTADMISIHPQKEIFNYYHISKESTNTRRILEIQSDLFQKGRDKSNLTNKEASPEDWIIEEDFGFFNVVDGKTGQPINSFNNKEKAQEFLNQYKGDNKNQFLQLLNKDNNWVTFFVKSIIQDSNKKGYEKVLFPTGNTASKVEGHSTLEEFKKQKEDRIKELENRIEGGKWLIKNRQVSGFDKDSQDIVNKSFKFLKDQTLNDAVYKTKKEEIDTELNKIIVTTEGEITQLKEELQRVEKEGFGALRPIFNFYENTVTNILNKTYGKENVKQITDEYGNTWNEIFVASIETTDILLDNLTDLSDFNATHEYIGDKSAWEKSGEIYKLGKLINTNTQLESSIPIKAKGKMTFSYAGNKRNDIKAASTFEAIKKGERTATTRYESDGHIGYWKSLKKGDIIEWESANEEKVLVEVTKPLHKLIGSGKTAEQWSKLEGWSVSYFNSKVKPKLDKAWQIEYKLLSDVTKETTSNDNEAYFIIADKLEIVSNDYVIANERGLNNYLTEAKKTNLPIYLYSQNEGAWRKFVNNQWVRVNYVTVPKNFKTNQTANLKTTGKNAIRKVYRDTKNNEVTPITIEELPTVQTEILNEPTFKPIKKGNKTLFKVVKTILETDELSEEVTAKSLVNKESNVWEENINHYFDDLIESGIITDKQFDTLKNNSQAYELLVELLRAKFGVKTNNLQEVEFALENIAHRNVVATKEEEIVEEEVVLEETKFTDAELEHYVNIVKRILYMITLNNTSDFNINTLRDNDDVVNVKALVLRVLTNNYNKENKNSDQIKAFDKLIADLEDENGKLYEYAWNAVNKDLNINKNQFEEEYQDKLVSKNWDSGADNTTSHSQQISKEFKMYFNQIPIMDNSKGTIDAEGNAINPLEPHLEIHF